MPISLPASEPAPPQQPSGETKRRVIAALLSAIAPGAGQILLGQHRKGQALLGIFVIVCLGFWPLRLLRFFPGLVLLNLVPLGLALYATSAALLTRRNAPLRAPSKWWLLPSLPLAYVGFNFVVTSLLFATGFRAFKFASSSMGATLLVNDQFIVDTRYYREHSCSHDDLVLIHTEERPTVKRVIAVGGDTIEGKSQQILLNGRVLDESFVQHAFPGSANPELDTFGPITVSDGKYFVMGDNRDLSLDSRSSEIGQLDRDAIVGRPLYIYRSHEWSRLGRELH